MVRKSKRAALIGSAIGLALAVSFTPASANWYAPNGNGGGGAGSCNVNGNITDDKNVDFHNVDPSAELSDASAFTRNSLLDPTALNTSYTSPQNTSIDVLLGDAYYDEFCEAALGVQWTTDGFSGLRGMQVCDYLQGNRCGQGVVRISNRYFDQHGQQGDRWIVCHEVGHAIGLVHRNSAAPSSRAVDCVNGATVDVLESTVTAGVSGLAYDSLSDTYSYVWKTSKQWAGTCRRLNVTLDDGSTHFASFDFRK